MIPSTTIRVTSWSCGMREHVCMHYGLCQRRCHLVTSLFLLDHLPDDPETARNTEVSKFTCQNVRNRLLLHKQQYMPFNGSRYKFDKHHVSNSKKAQRKRRFIREIEKRCAIHGTFHNFKKVFLKNLFLENLPLEMYLGCCCF